MKRALRKFASSCAVALASGLYISYLPAYFRKDQKWTGAGLLGTLWGVAIVPWLPIVAHQQILAWLGALAIAVVVSDIAEERQGVTDDPRIVIDEIVGYWTAMLFLPHSIATFVLAFVLFRVFDVWKPTPIAQVSHLPGGWGIVADDVAAGIYTTLLLQIAQRIHPF